MPSGASPSSLFSEQLSISAARPRRERLSDAARSRDAFDVLSQSAFPLIKQRAATDPPSDNQKTSARFALGDHDSRGIMRESLTLVPAVRV